MARRIKFTPTLDGEKCMQCYIDDFWVEVRDARPVHGSAMTVGDLEWRVYDSRPRDGGHVLEYGRAEFLNNDMPQDRVARSAVVEAIVKLKRDRLREEFDRLMSA